jgi:acylphosphatase
MVDKSNIEACRLIISGQVQGVGFRYFTQMRANELGLVGWVKNLPNGNVEAYLEGSKSDILRAIKILKRGPSFSYVDSVEEEWRTPSGEATDFRITY